MRSTIESELEICGAVIRALLAAGYTLQLESEGEPLTFPTRDSAALMRALRQCDIENLLAFTREPEGTLVYEGGVQFVYGNGADVWSDHTMNLDSLLRPVANQSTRKDSTCCALA